MDNIWSLGPFLIPIVAIIGGITAGIVANITREAGFPPLNITPVDFVALYRQQLAQAQPGQIGTA